MSERLGELGGGAQQTSRPCSHSTGYNNSNVSPSNTRMRPWAGWWGRARGSRLPQHTLQCCPYTCTVAPIVPAPGRNGLRNDGLVDYDPQWDRSGPLMGMLGVLQHLGRSFGGPQLVGVEHFMCCI